MQYVDGDKGCSCVGVCVCVDTYDRGIGTFWKWGYVDGTRLFTLQMRHKFAL